MFLSFKSRAETSLKVLIALYFFANIASSVDAAEVKSANRAVRHASESIRLGELQRHAEILADDTMEGREAGKAGGRSAATYIMRTLRAAKLQPAGLDGTYFQPFQAGCRNILAKIPASNQQNPGETILVTAHYDHVGFGSARNSKGTVGSIHNGADDNASGVATVLEVAKALQQFQGDLDRDIVFVFWDGEEKGLWGSKHWLANPTIELKQVRMMINVDMVGRLREKLSVYGTRSMPGMRFDWSEANKGADLRLDFPWEILDNSDHYPFLKQGIPISMVHTGLHDDYHTPSDDAHRLNYQGIRDSSRLILNFAIQTANRNDFPAFRWGSIYESTKNQIAHERPRIQPKRTLGITLSSSRNGLKIESVVVGSMADKIELKPGQRIIEIDGVPAKTISDFRNKLSSTYRTIKLLIEHRGEQQEVVIDFKTRRPRIGLAWRTDKAEPAALMVSSVLPDTPAAESGMKRLDRIHTFNGTQIRDSDHFRALTNDADGRIELLIERDGQLKYIEMTVPKKTSD